MLNFIKQDSANGNRVDELDSSSLASTKVAIQDDQHEIPHLHTTLGTTTTTGKLFSQETDPTTTLSRAVSTSFQTSIDAITKSIQPTTSPNSHQEGHIENVGTVVSEDDVPKEWGSEFLGVDKAQKDRFIGYMVVVFAATIIIIIGIGWWR
ncbi:hypothetical protein IQ06DRAFT_366528 [Phaeosphaeriaceae sp. SRC1lsM3a]|nr:hypothetical protein IQ06DRAFT_366528 [Stagonospora sp. SRC1lsM3a]